MLELRPITDDDVPRVNDWLHRDHVRRWYEIPSLGITLDDWLDEIGRRHAEFHWLTHLIAEWRGVPIGLCQYYRCADSDEDFGLLPVPGSYGIDYLVGEEAYLGAGHGKTMIAALAAAIFSFPDAERVTAGIDPRNTASERALLSCGFTLFDAERARYVLNNTDV
ncbi:MAG: acetyltransferase [Planctomycetes bacterium]|nr:acetyltransferase [Planctomycetota bacterium]MCD7896333.1 acetyltransferase [Planctomycetaceae bacterium]